MKRHHLPQRRLMQSRAFPVGMAVASAMMIVQQNARAAVMAVDLGTAANFAVLAGAGIVINGTPASMQITGDIGSSPTITITGLANALLVGVNHAGDSVTQQAKLDLSAAILDATGRTPTLIFAPVQDLAGMTLLAGIYNDSSSFSNSGTLTLDGGGDSNAVWIFQAGSTLTTSAGSNVILTGGAQASNIFWQVGSSATLGVSSTFAGTIIAADSITLNTGAALSGRALASNAAVTLDSNIIGIPEVGSTLLLGVGSLILAARRRRDSYCVQP
jgi:hypothetical protein